ncbi:MAG: aminotransferase class V-fold PLP-dependent enzyme [Duodenibacillus sp.]|nr:aminotransferase class V-fold PLP-dependent enzyme [Duodenibacillus sp.]
MESAHPRLLERIAATNFEKTGCYGEDAYSDAARARIRAACRAPEADVHFLVGGTQANLAVISALLKPWQGVIAAKSGHISVHEAGSIERTGHKVIELAAVDGKLAAADVEAAFAAFEGDANNAHMVEPGMVYISQPSEYGTLYSLAELEALAAAARARGALLYIDGARLIYGLAAGCNDASLADIARLADAFYIGGTKAGALFGEAVVFRSKALAPRFFTLMKQQGALLAKGKLLGLQFEALFTDGLYEQIGRHAVALADRLREGLAAKGYELLFGSPTNQVFVALTPAQQRAWADLVVMSFWEALPGGRTAYRLATSWATAPEEVEALLAALPAA